MEIGLPCIVYIDYLANWQETCGAQTILVLAP
jgi:hypothetical protein